jgi:hypothetical protein
LTPRAPWSADNYIIIQKGHFSGARRGACLQVVRHPVRTGHRGRSRLIVEKGLLLGSMFKRYDQRRVVSVER